MKRSWKRLLFGALALALLGVAGVDGAPSASGQAPDPAPGVASVQPGHLDGPVAPLAGFESGAPTATESTFGEVIASNGGSPVESAHPESIIGRDQRLRVTNTRRFPNRAVGQIELVSADFQQLICTGWLIDDNSILTAGHCLYDSGQIIQSATFFPGRNRGNNPYGGCPVYQGWAPNRWINNSAPAFDFAVMQLGTGPGDLCNIGATVGHFGMIAFARTNGLAGRPVTVQGYPGDKPFGTHSKMSGRIKKSGVNMAYYPMDTFGGQSGSPVWQHRGAQAAGPCHGPCGLAVHAYGTGLPGARNLNAGPRLTGGRIGQIRAFAGQNGG